MGRREGRRREEVGKEKREGELVTRKEDSFPVKMENRGFDPRYPQRPVSGNARAPAGAGRNKKIGPSQGEQAVRRRSLLERLGHGRRASALGVQPLGARDTASLDADHVRRVRLDFCR